MPPAQPSTNSRRLPCVVLSLGNMLLCCLAAQAAGTDSQDLQEFCQWESFNATCPEGSVILMTSARYGRMKLGRCMSRDYYIGCSADVILQADEICSGRTHCTIKVPKEDLHEIQPCPKDIGAYLETSYTCAPVEQGQGELCHAYKPLYVTATTGGFMSSLVTMETDLGSGPCPWHLKVPPGQRLNVTLYDFGVLVNRGQDASYCPVYATIKELGQQRDVPICGGTQRERRVFTSTGSDVEINMARPSGDGYSQYFLLKYDVVGCTTPAAPPGGWLRREDSTLVIGCNNTVDKWHLVCRGTGWVGEFKNCTGPVSDVSTAWKLGNLSQEDTAFPFGLLVSVVIGVVLGVIIGTSLLAVVLLCRKRRRRSSQTDEVLDPMTSHTYTSPGQQDSGYGNSLQKWRPAPTNTHPGHYAHIWELKQAPAAAPIRNTPITASAGIRNTSAGPMYPGHPNRVDVPPAATDTADNFANHPRTNLGQTKEHVYESPKFHRRNSNLGDAPYYHEFDQADSLDNPELEREAVHSTRQIR